MDHALLIRSFAPTATPLVAFAVAAITAPLGGRAATVVLSVLVLVVAAAGVVGGRAAALVAAVMAALAFDFFHVAPLRVLHARSLGELVAGLAVVATVSASRSR